LKVYFAEFSVSTKSRFEIVDITDRVEREASNSKIKDGICLV